MSYRSERQEAQVEAINKARDARAVQKGRQLLKDTISSSIAAMGGLFQLWDRDGSGTITRSEFAEAVAALGLSLPPQVADLVFAEFDIDQSGAMSYTEFLRFALRDALARSSARVVDIFKRFDADSSGEVGPEEFRRAITEMGFDVPREHLDGVFAELDEDGSGQLSFHEMHKQLRQGASIKLSRRLRVGGAGRIRMTTKDRLHPELGATSSGGVSQRPQSQVEASRVALPGPSGARPVTAPTPSIPESLLGCLSTTTVASTLPKAPDGLQSAVLVPSLALSPATQSVEARAPSLFASAERRSDAIARLGLNRHQSVRGNGNRCVLPGGGGAPRPGNGRFVGFASDGVVVCDERRRRKIFNERLSAVQRNATIEPKSELHYKRRTQSGYTGPRWTEPLPALTEDGWPIWTWTSTRGQDTTLSPSPPSAPLHRLSTAPQGRRLKA